MKNILERFHVFTFSVSAPSIQIVCVQPTNDDERACARACVCMPHMRIYTYMLHIILSTSLTRQHANRQHQRPFNTNPAMDTLPFDALCHVYEHLHADDLLAVSQLGSVHCEAAHSVARRRCHQYTLTATADRCIESLLQMSDFLAPYVRTLTIDFRAPAANDDTDTDETAQRLTILTALVRDATRLTDLTVISPPAGGDFSAIVLSRLGPTAHLYYDLHHYRAPEQWDNGSDVTGQRRHRYRKQIVTPAMAYRCWDMADGQHVDKRLAADLAELPHVAELRTLKLRLLLQPGRAGGDGPQAHANRFLRDMAAANRLATLHWQMFCGPHQLALEPATVEALQRFTSLRELRLIAAWRLVAVQQVLTAMRALERFENAACAESVGEAAGAEVLRRLRPDMRLVRVDVMPEEL